MALSWYPRLNLDAFSGMRRGADGVLDAAYTKINHVAAELAGWFDHIEYRPYLDHDGTPIPPMSVVDLASGSSDTTRSGPSNQPASSSPLYQQTSSEDDESSGSSSESSEERPVDLAATGASQADPAATQMPPSAPGQSATTPPPEAGVPPSGEQAAPTAPST